MASIKERNGKFCVIYTYTDSEGNRKQKWETFSTKGEALKRKRIIEYKMQKGTLVLSDCKYLKDLLEEYVSLYGKEKWALSTYESNTALIRNYILPVIGDTRLGDINARFLEKYYQTLQKKIQAVGNPFVKNTEGRCVSTSTIRDIHKLLRSCFRQAIRWEAMDKNPAVDAIVPKHKQQERQIWTAETLMRATELCDDPDLKLAINLAFCETLRIGELAAITWDCVDISPSAIEEDRAFIMINKIFQRVSKEALKSLDNKDVILVFPSEGPLCKTVRVFKTPKTESSVRKIFLPRSVAEMLIERKKEQDELKDILGDEYHDYNLVMATVYGMPIETSGIRKRFKKFIQKNNLPPVDFHSLRHTSVTYKLKLNGGDIKAVQGDSGHSQVSMVTEVYSHILDEDRRKNAQMFEEAFYGKKNLDPQIHGSEEEKALKLPDGIDPELLMKVLSNPEMRALLEALARGVG